MKRVTDLSVRLGMWILMLAIAIFFVQGLLSGHRGPVTWLGLAFTLVGLVVNGRTLLMELKR